MQAPDLFELSDVDGHSSATVADVPPELQDDAREAASSCPEQAIVIS
jgi:ferredoxin